VQGKVKQSKVSNRLERLHDLADAVFLSMKNFTVPFTNNLAERDLHMSKVKMKSLVATKPRAAEIHCRIHSYISMASKLG
jgi:transposase